MRGFLPCFSIALLSACSSRSSVSPSNGNGDGRAVVAVDSGAGVVAMAVDSGASRSITTVDSGASGAADELDAGSSPDGTPAGNPSTRTDASNPAANVRFSQARQKIDGFGVSNAWEGSVSANATAVYEALFSKSKGAGLSIVRNRIPFRENLARPGFDDKFIDKDASGQYVFTTNADGSKSFSLNWGNWDLSGTASLIQALTSSSDYDVTFMSTAWSPPNDAVSRWKLYDTNSANKQGPTAITPANWYDLQPEVGGFLDPNHYQDYADLLADYALGWGGHMKTALTALSPQNEPNFACTYESADWTAAQLHAFVEVLKTEFAKKGVFTRLAGLKLLLPEYQNVKEDLVLPILGDPSTLDLLGVVGVHQYEFGPGSEGSYIAPLLTNSLGAKKHVWMTEWSTAAWAGDSSMKDALLLARLVHMDLLTAQMSGFFYWWAWGSGNAALVQNGATVTVPKRTYALGQFSRFVRPGWTRVDTLTPQTGGVYMSAYRDPSATQIAIVLINTGGGTATVPLSIDVGQFGTLSAYRTSDAAGDNISLVGTLQGGPSTQVDLAPASVTTLVGSVL